MVLDATPVLPQKFHHCIGCREIPMVLRPFDAGPLLRVLWNSVFPNAEPDVAVRSVDSQLSPRGAPEMKLMPQQFDGDFSVDDRASVGHAKL